VQKLAYILRLSAYYTVVSHREGNSMGAIRLSYGVQNCTDHNLCIASLFASCRVHVISSLGLCKLFYLLSFCAIYRVIIVNWGAIMLKIVLDLVS